MADEQRAVVAMTDDEARSFVAASRTATLATIGPGGVPHLTARGYGLVDAALCFETKSKSHTEDRVYWAAARSLLERYYGPVDSGASQHVEQMMHNRVVVHIAGVRLRSWDHRKLGLPPMPRAGTTAS